jgi:hypothetical protein
MEAQRGICTACGKSVVGEHNCNADYVFLQTTDWKVIRQRDQIDAGITPSLTTEEFQQLLADRQAARTRLQSEETV